MACWLEWLRVDWSPPILFSLYVNNMPSPSQHVKLALYTDDTAIIAICRKPTLLISYPESYLNDLQRWMSEWWIAINVSKSTAIIFALARCHFIQHQPVTLFSEPIQWVDIARYSGVTLDTRLTWSPHIDQVRKRTAQRGVCWDLSCIGRVNSSSERLPCYISSSSSSWWIMCAPHGVPLPAHMSGGNRCCNVSVFALLLVPHSTYVTGRYTRTWVFRCLPTASEPWLPAFYSKLADVGNPLVRQIGRYLRRPRVAPSPYACAKDGRSQQAIWGHRPQWPRRPNESRSALISRALFGYIDWGFPWFSSVVRQIPGYTVQSRCTACNPHVPGTVASPKRLKKSLLRLSQSGLRTETANQPKFIPSIISFVPPRH